MGSQPSFPTYKSWHGEPKGGDLVCQHQRHDVARVEVAFWFGNDKAATHSQRRENLQNVRIEADGVAEHHHLLITCDQDDIDEEHLPPLILQRHEHKMIHLLYSYIFTSQGIKSFTPL